MDELPEMMDAIVFAAEEKVVFKKVPCPRIVHASDVIVKVTACSVCGSDLHPYHGREKGIEPGTIVGHEFVGVIVQKGAEVSGLELGDRVASPFTSCCGGCFYCASGATCRCCHSQAHLFGWVSEGESQLPPHERRGLEGSQAQYVRVPLAAGTLVKLPDDVSDEAGLLLGDILSTAWFAAERGGVAAGDSVAVLGCGPVGLLAAMAARHMGAAQVFAVDSVPERLALAAECGATPLSLRPPTPGGHAAGPPHAPAPAAAAAAASDAAAPSSPPPSPTDSVIAAVRAATGGRGADVVLEAVGSSAALRLAFDLTRPMGTLSSVGVHTAPGFPFSPVEAYNKNLTLRAGRCPARSVMGRLLPALRAGELAGVPYARVFTHRMALREGVAAYDMFARRADGCVKVVLDPWA